MRLLYVAKVNEILKRFCTSITMACCCGPRNVLNKDISQVSLGRQGVDWKSWSINDRFATFSLTDVVVVDTFEELSSLLVSCLFKKCSA